MNQHTRNFEAKTAVRESVPLLIGLMGPSGGGKTFSALRLASGIQQATGGDIFGIDTEARRMTHYADRFKFRHVSFAAPFGSLDYLEALRYCVKQGGRIIIVDSMSHEHEGPGGMIDFHDKELDRLGGTDFAKRERVKMLAWQKPKSARRALINGLLQLEANFIFCFRAKSTAKPIKVNGKIEVINQGFMPIAGEEFVFEQTMNCLLLPAAGGVPTWHSDNMGERQMVKLPSQFKEMFTESRPLDEGIGRQLAEWAKGVGPATRPAQQQQTEAADDFGDDDPTARLTAIDNTLVAAAEQGMDALKEAWAAVPKDYREPLKSALDRRHKPRAAEVDRARTNGGSHAQPNGGDGSADHQGAVGVSPDAPVQGADAPATAVQGNEPQATAAEASTPPADAQAPPTPATDPIAAARERGAADFKKGVQRKACPGEYRDKPEGSAWVDGWAKARAEAGVG